MMARVLVAVGLVHLSCALAFAGHLQAQVPAGRTVLVGTVQTPAGEPLSAASVVVRAPLDSAVVAAVVTGPDGRFRIEALPAGTYLLEIALLGYAPLARSDLRLPAGETEVDLGALRLEQAVLALPGVEVIGVAERLQVLADRTVYAARDLAAAAGGVATDVLRSIPELQVDVEGRVTSRGATPRIHINGRPPAMEGEALTRYLEQLAAEQIERVEVIANPSARYEAQGEGGIVNIVLARPAELGLSGSVSANAGTPGRGGGSTRLNYQLGRVVLFGGVTANLSSTRSSNSELRENRVTQPISYISQEASNRSGRDFGNADLTAEVKLGERGLAWFLARGNRSHSDSDGTAAYTHLDEASLPTDRYDRRTGAANVQHGTSAQAGFRYVATPQRNEWSVEVRRNENLADTTSESEKVMLLGRITPDPAGELLSDSRDQDQPDVSLQTDLIRPLPGDAWIEVGYRGSGSETNSAFRRTTSARDDAVGGGMTASELRYRDRIHAGYLTLNRAFGPLSAQVGLRLEDAEILVALPRLDESFEQGYRSLFPSVNLAADLGGGRQLRLSYARRVNRPDWRFLDPTDASPDPLSRFVGNPDLKPMFTHSFGLDASRTGDLGVLRASPYVRLTTDSWEQLRTVDVNGVSTTQFQNFSTVENYGTSLSASLRQWRGLTGLASVNVSRQVRDASNLSDEYSGSATFWFVNGNVSRSISGTASLSATLSYWPARDMAQGRASAMSWSSLSGRQQLLDRRGTLTLTVNDPFNLERTTFTSRDATHVITGRAKFTSRRATVAFTYSFGRPPQSGRRMGATPEGGGGDPGAVIPGP